MKLKFYAALCLVGANFLLVNRASAQNSSQLKQVTVDQITSLLKEKESRTPGQKKMASDLLQGAREFRGLQMAPGVSLAKVKLSTNGANQVKVDISADVTDALLAKITAMGGSVIFPSKQYHTLRAYVPLAKVEAIADLSEVKFIEPAVQSHLLGAGNKQQNAGNVKMPKVGGNSIIPSLVRKEATPRTKRLEKFRQKVQDYVMTLGTGTVNSEADHPHRADDARNAFGFAGQGIKIGVLSDSYNAGGTAPASVLSGNLPGVGNPLGNTTPVTVLADYAGATDEGQAMCQIVHDLAPKAQLFFATADQSEAGFAANIVTLRTVYGCDIILDDVGYFDENPFEDGVVAQAVNTVTALGALYFSSAGNAGNLKDGTSSNYEGDFNNVGSPAFTGSTKTGGSIHNFGTAAAPINGDIITAAQTVGGTNYYSLFWADPYGKSSNDYDLFLVSSAGVVKASATTTQNGTQNPYELISTSATFAAGDRLVVYKTAAAAVRAFHISTNNDASSYLTIGTASATGGHNCALNGFCVAATPAPAAGGNPFVSTNKAETFSSDGPRRIFYNADSTPVTPGSFTFASGGYQTRQKPDFTAADGVSTSLPSFTPFYGTSAAAPHAGAIAALLLCANKTLAVPKTIAQIKSILISTALDIEDPGYDYVSGAGILQAYQAVQAVGATPAPNVSFGATTVTEGSYSNGNGTVDPGETGKLVVQLNDLTPTAATNVTAVVSSNTAGVTVTTNTFNYGTIAGGGSLTNTAMPFIFAVSPTVACGSTINFQILVSFGGGGPSPASYTVSVVVGTFATVASVSTTLGTAMSSTSAYRFVTGIQTGRIGRVTSTASSTCAVPITTNPGLGSTTGPRVFDEYVFKNTTGVSKCMIATINVPNSAALYSAAYTKAGYVPSNPSTNYLAEPAQTLPTLTYSFTVAANDSFIVVVSAVDSTTGTANEAGTPYSIGITYLNCTTSSTCTPVVITTATLPAGATGVRYIQHITATGGSGAYIDSLSGALPGGITFAGDSLSGTPTQAGTFPITIKVVDPIGCPSATMTYNLVIAGIAPATVTATAGTPQNATPGTVFATALQATVKDASNNPLAGVSVTFKAPTTGATGTFAGGVSSVVVVTNASGIATAPAFTANSTAGTYADSALVNGIAPALFTLTNFCPTTLVTNSADTGVGSLRYIVANACSGATITFAPSVTNIALTSGDITLFQPITITGPGANALTISGSHLSRIFLVNSTSTTAAMNISGITFINGMPQPGTGTTNSANGGGAILITAGGTVTINSCYFLNNDASLTDLGEGGGIDNEGAVTLTVNNSGFTNNIAPEDGGGIAQWSSKVGTFSNCTFSGNSSIGDATGNHPDGWGGGLLIANSTGSGTTAGATLTNCTFSGNSAIYGGNIFKYSGTFRLGSTILAGGIVTSGATANGKDILNNTGTITSNGYNVVQSTGGYTLAAANNSLGVNPKVLPLANYGGAMPTILPMSSSVAINGGITTTPTLTTDQRGFARVTGGRVDMGAVETNYAATIAAGTPQTTSIGTAFPIALAATVTESGNLIAGDSVLFGAPATGASGTFANGLKTTTVVTNASGVATATTFTANGTVGTYNDTASIGGLFTSLKYALTNKIATIAFTSCPNVNLVIARPGYNVYNNEPLSMYTLDTATGAATLLAGGPLKDLALNKNIEVNGAGVNSQDGFVYAIRDTINTAGTAQAAMLYRIGSNYGNDMVGTLPSSPLLAGENLSVVIPSAGSFDDLGNYYYVAMSGAYSFTSNSFTPSTYYIGKVANVSSLAIGNGILAPSWIKVDFTTAPAAFKTGIFKNISSATGTGAGTGFQDMAFSNLYKSLYVYSAYATGATYTGQLFAINPITGVATFYANPPAFGAANNEVAGISTTASGNLRVFTTSGDIYKPVMSGVDFTSTFTKVGASGVTPLGVTGSIRGDLASCGIGAATLPTTRLTLPSSITIGLPNQIVAYPNPAQGITTISVGQPLNNATVRLLGSAGNVIAEKTGVSGYTFQMDLTGKAGGMYTVEVIQGGNSQLVKVIKP